MKFVIITRIIEKSEEKIKTQSSSVCQETLASLEAPFTPG
jgi:hypothetical protein